MDKYERRPPLKAPKLFLGSQIFFRILTLGTALAAALLMMNNKDAIDFGGIIIAARYDYSREFKFFVCENFIACASSAISLIYLSVVGFRAWNPSTYFRLFLHDLILMSLLLSGCTAATSIGLLAKYGNEHIGWSSICGFLVKFCDKGTIATALSYIALISSFVLTLTSAHGSRQFDV